MSEVGEPVTGTALFIGDFSQPTDEPARLVLFVRYRPEQVLAAVRDLWAASAAGDLPPDRL
jgi:hypothetical protein